MTDTELIVIDNPAPNVSRITLNRPEKRNAISTPLRVAVLDALYANDHNPDVRISIVRGAGACFSAGYDLSGGLMSDPPHHTAPGDGVWSRHVTESWFSIWDLAKPVIAQVHGLCIGGATELAQACDLVYVATDARISYPVVRVLSPPDWPYHTALLGMRRAMELMLSGDEIDGDEAVTIGWANRAFTADDLDVEVLKRAERMAGVATDLQQINKRLVHRQADILGTRAAIRAGSEMQALAGRQESVQELRKNALEAMKAANKNPQ
jgi:enoyl-CoA hydratase